jgi:uncharacterized protein (DUF779 family)
VVLYYFTSMESIPRVLITPEAVKIIGELREQHGELMFHQSGGCCDGSQPMCFEKNEFKVGSNDVYLGDIDGCGFFMSNSQFEYWKHTQLNIDIVAGRGSSFSLEIPLGLRFIVRSRLFREEELEHLTPVYSGEEYLETHQA